MFNFLNSFFLIFFIDLLGKKISYYFLKDTITDSTRWFFMHFIINTMTTYYSYYDLTLCFSKYDICYKYNWTLYTYNVFWLALTLHIYHMIFFSISINDFIHHFLMCIIAGSFCYYSKSLLCSCALFFVNGLPGTIDYFLLWLTKINKLDKLIEKKIYVYISVWLRSPGCIIVSFLGLCGLNDHLNNMEYFILICKVIPLVLLYWNGQYYMMITCRDNYKKLNHISYNLK